MPSIIDSLVMTLGLDASGFVKGQKVASDSLAKTRDEAVKSGKDIEKSGLAAAEAINKIAKEAMVLFAVFTAGKSIKEFIADLTSADGALGRFAQSMGLMPSTVSQLGMAVERNGGSAQSAAAAYQSLNDQLSALKTGAGSAILPVLSQLSALGGRAIDISQTVDQQMRSIFANIYEAHRKDPALADYLGRQIGLSSDVVNWAETHNPQQQAADLAESARLGGANAASIKAAQELTRQYNALKQASEDLGRQIFVSLAPSFNEALKGILEWVEANKEWLKTEISDRIKAFVDYLKSLDWKAIGEDIKSVAHEANEVAKAFGGWKTLLEGIFLFWTGAKFAGIIANVARLRALLGLPALGVGALAGGAAILGGALAESTPTPDPTQQQRDDAKRVEEEYRKKGELYGWRDFIPKWAGGNGRAYRSKAEREHDAATSGLRRRGRDASNTRHGTKPAEPTTPGTYRPVYNLGAQDLSDQVVNTVAGEAYANNAESTDAVINNMLNRVGTSTYGPSGNLQEVARAPGQYAGYRRAGAKEAEFIRSRIRAIASGGVADNTKGSNEYRASYYHGPWYRQHADAPVVGGNRFAYNPKGGRGPYGPYAQPRRPAKTPPMERPKPLQTWWHGAPDAVDYSSSLQRMAMASTIHHNIDNSQRSSTNHVGSIVVNTAATDGSGVAADLRRDLQRRGLLTQADYGLA